jgi:hypothetical protein
MYYNSFGAPLGPEDVAMIRGLVREHCDIRRCERQGTEAEDAARHLLWWFQSGVTDRDSLRRLLPPT